MAAGKVRALSDKGRTETPREGPSTHGLFSNNESTLLSPVNCEPETVPCVASPEVPRPSSCILPGLGNLSPEMPPMLSVCAPEVEQFSAGVTFSVVDPEALFLSLPSVTDPGAGDSDS